MSSIEAQTSPKDVDMEKMMAIEAELSRPETSHSTDAVRVKMVIPPSPPAKDLGQKAMTFPVRPNPLRVNPIDDRRPMTSSSRRLSFSTMATTKRPIKFGKGKYALVELVPQPSDDEDDPLVCGTLHDDGTNAATNPRRIGQCGKRNFTT